MNVLAVPELALADITGAGAQRVSVGGALTLVAAKAMADAARAMLETGDLSALAARLPLGEMFGTVQADADHDQTDARNVEQ